jgi:PIN domain nuclease of toxin-antitoxin system
LTALLGADFRILEVTATLLEKAAELPRHHADPFDRVLVADALSDDLEKLTRDIALADYGVRLAAVI